MSLYNYNCVCYNMIIISSYGNKNMYFYGPDINVMSRKEVCIYMRGDKDIVLLDELSKFVNGYECDTNLVENPEYYYVRID